MRILFTFENTLPSTEADAEVFVATACYLARLTSESWLHVPSPAHARLDAVERLAGLPVIRAYAPVRFAPLRHLCCGLTLVFRKEFRQADLVYTRNLWIAWMAMAVGQRVAFDHYRPWPDQIPPLQFWLYRLFSQRRLSINICHSNYTLEKYLRLGVPAGKLRCIRNGFEPERLKPLLTAAEAKRQVGIAGDRKTVVYTGRLNRKKGLDLVIAAAKELPDMLFVLVGSQGSGPIEAMSRSLSNVRIVPWQSPDALAPYIFAADVLLIPPSSKPLTQYGSTVLPLKLFLYMASGRPILAGNTPDVAEILRHNENAVLCLPDCVDTLVAGLAALMRDPGLSRRLAETALTESSAFTWQARAERIAEVLEQRLQLRLIEHGTWSDRQFRIWMHQSWRWVCHLVARRSWVLPPEEHRPAYHGDAG